MTEERTPAPEQAMPTPNAVAPQTSVNPPYLLAQILFWMMAQSVNGLIIVAAWALFAVLFLALSMEFANAIGYGFLIAFFGSFLFRALLIQAIGPALATRIPGLAQYAPSTQHPTNPTENFREIVETVVFVVVLVLMLKSFVAEAFVIPTGSMAETLWGYQKLVTCPSCGHRFPVNASREAEQTRGGFTYIYGCTCPNCRQRITLLRPQDDPTQTPPGTIAIPDPGFVVPEEMPGIIRMFTNGPRSGDRVLVSKYPYDIPGMGPHRLDVVVFKFPGDDHEGIFPDTGPFKNHVPINYIKRLVGMPGETIAIHRGKLFVLPPEQSPKYPQDDEARKDPGKAIQMWRSKTMPQQDWLHYNDAQARELFEQQKFHILRKPADIVLSMMRLVYDNDHPAKDLTGPEYQRWVPARDSAWSEQAQQRAFQHSGGSETTWLHYRHILRDEPGKPQIITDFMGYNSNMPGERDPSIGENWASDLILECAAQAETAEGKLTLELSRGPSRFQAQFDFATGTCSLYRFQDGMKPQTLGTQPFVVSPRGTYNLRFANVDDRLLVWVNGKLPFGEGVEYVPAPKLHPTTHNDLDRPASIGASGGRLTVRRLKLFRDTYYTVNGTSPDMGRDRWGGGNDGFDPLKPATFNNWAKVPFATYYVQPEHYLCLGDNSPESSDGRSWGLVPQRLMLGRAVMVYFPFTRVGPIR